MCLMRLAYFQQADKMLRTQLTIQQIKYLLSMESDQDSFDMMPLPDWSDPYPNILNLRPPTVSAGNDRSLFDFNSSQIQPNLLPNFSLTNGSNYSYQPQQFPKLQVVPVKADRKAKNRAAAKQSRAKQKIYLQNIQQKTQKLEGELQKVQKELQQVKNEVANQNRISIHSLTGAFATQMDQVFAKLRGLIQKGDKQKANEEINLSIDSIFYRFAVMGRERVSLINKGYRQFYELAVPPLHKYIMWSANKGCHLFADQNNLNQQHEHWFDVKQVTNKFSQQQQKKMMEIKQKIIGIRAQIGKAVVALIYKREELAALCRQIDDLHQDLRGIYTPVQMANVILYHQVLNFKEELNFLYKICEDDEVQELGLPKKLHKSETV